MTELRESSLAHYQELLDLQHAPIEQIVELQKSKLLELVRFSRANNPFYKNHLPDLSKLPQQTPLDVILNLIPIMNRRFVKENYEEMKIFLPGTDESLYGQSSTSGSTGEPVTIFKYLPEYLKSNYAISLLEWKWHNRSIDKRLGTLMIGATDLPIHQIGPPLSYLGNPAPGFRYRSDSRPISELINALIEHRPNYLFCNLVTLRLIMKELSTGNYTKIEIEQILAVSDLVDESFRQQAMDVFGSRVVDRYSTEEFGLMAVECASHANMHLIAPELIVEILDDSNRPVLPGDSGRVVVTALNNPAMPLIRYEVGDIAKLWNRHCSADITWPCIDSIVGRTRDYVDYPDGSRNIATFVYSKILELSDLFDYQAVLFTDVILLIAGVKQPLSDTSKQVIHNELARIFGSHLKTKIIESTNVPLLKPGKRPEFIRHSKPFWITDQPADYLT